MKTLKEILYKAGIVSIHGNTDVEISSICFDSRFAKDGCLFIAIKGTKLDGHEFINSVIQSGAKAIIYQEDIVIKNDNISYVKVKDSGAALGQIASNFYNNPSSNLKLIGITGTNGKTTFVTLSYNLFRKLGYKCGLLSTVKNLIEEEEIPASHTTPDAIQLNELLGKMVQTGVQYCFMEVSSHAIAQNRIAGLEFSGGVFSNITHDHLDYHKTFTEYLKVKKSFFDNLPSSAFALSNVDDKNGNIILQNTKAIKKTYALKSPADFKAKIIENLFEGLQLSFDGNDVWCRLVGEFNAYNLLAVYACALILNQQRKDVLTHLSNLEAAEGRFDYLKSPGGVIAIVDYAHTPDALSNVLNTITDIRQNKEKIITIVGCGGDRDRTKRPIMADIACQYSDKVILTSDNPRSEDPETILNEMYSGVKKQYEKNVIIITDRKQAIKTAISLAKNGDIILVAGKGHEKYQEIKGIKHPFDDKVILKDYLFNK